MITAIWIYIFFVLYPWLIYPFILRLSPYDTLSAASCLKNQSWLIVTAGRNCDDRIEDHLNYMDILAEHHGNAQAIYIDDGSDIDNTERLLDIVDKLRYDRVTILHANRHVGKERALATALSCAHDNQMMGDSVLFLDVGVKVEQYDIPSTDSVLKMLDTSKRYQHFDVAGMAFEDETENESRYIQFEMYLRALEECAGGLVGAGGMAMAVKSQYVPLSLSPPCDLTLVRVAKEQGKRFIHGGPFFTAHYKPTQDDSFKRRVRTTMRGMAGFKLVRGEHWWNFKLISHKAMRWFSSMLIALNPLTWVMWGDLIAPHRAVLVAAINHVRGQRITKWEGTKR